jgi:hypothetical protein
VCVLDPWRASPQEHQAHESDPERPAEEDPEFGHGAPLLPQHQRGPSNGSNGENSRDAGTRTVAGPFSYLAKGDHRSDHGVFRGWGFELVGAPRFELGTPCTPCKCATRLRHAPTGRELYETRTSLFTQTVHAASGPTPLAGLGGVSQSSTENTARRLRCEAPRFGA